MELLDIVDEKGNPTGEVKERALIHREGLLHRTSHVWIARKNRKSGMDLLLQKRSAKKDSHRRLLRYLFRRAIFRRAAVIWNLLCGNWKKNWE